MDNFYHVILAFLAILACFDLFVGVSNDAVNFLNSALGCRIATWARFSRKNYFYPDIPKGFQTTQYDEPLCTAGHLDVEVDGETYRVEIERVHLEEDTGKNLHVGGSTGRIHGSARFGSASASIPPSASSASCASA